MPFVPFPSLDPAPPAGHPAPVLWLRSHRRPWAFPRRSTAEEIDAYSLWLHINALEHALRERERALRPPLSFRFRTFLHRLRFFYRATAGDVSPEALRDLEDHDQ